MSHDAKGLKHCFLFVTILFTLIAIYNNFRYEDAYMRNWFIGFAIAGGILTALFQIIEKEAKYES